MLILNKFNNAIQVIVIVELLVYYIKLLLLLQNIANIIHCSNQTKAKKFFYLQIPTIAFMFLIKK